MKFKSNQMQKNYFTIVFSFFFLPIAIFLFLVTLYPEFVFLTPLGLAVGPTTALLKPDLARGKMWKRRK